MHGAAFATYGAVNKSELRWLSGEQLQAIYRSSLGLERMFCKQCGSSILCRSGDEPDIEYIALGTVDGDPGCQPEYHIWVSSKAPWCTINDGLPQYEQEEPEA
jgi:hypothetical protein